MSPCIALFAALSSAPEALDFDLAVRLAAAELRPGETYELTLDVRLPEGVLATAAGTPGPVLQLDVPPSIELVGKDLWSAQALATNNHLRAPYERIVPLGASTVEFVLRAEPATDERIGVNVVAYLSDVQRERQRFVRHRVELPVAALATSVPVEGVSDWSPDELLLQLGDRVPEVLLWNSPDEDALVSLERERGTGWSVISTYRAHW